MSELDLVLERVVDTPRELIWKAWTQPELLKQWFTPAPWKTVECEIDLRPGGIFRTVFRSPEGEEFPNIGCYLEIVPNERLVWTSALKPGFRPSPPPGSGPTDFAFTAVITLETMPDGRTRYRATGLHADAESCAKHKAMGFEQGWGAALAQLLEAVRA